MINVLEVIKKTLESNGIRLGEATSDTEVEVYSIGNYIHRRKVFSGGVIHDKDKASLLANLKELREDSWYVSYYKNEDREFLADKSMDSLLLAMNKIDPISYVESILENNCSHIEVSLMEDFKSGSVSISKVDNTYDSQRDFAVKALEAVGLTQYEYSDSSPGLMDFSDGSDGDYELFHGVEQLAIHHSEISTINGRVHDDDENGRAVSSFWDDIDNKKDWLKTIDSREKIVVYHRKGKDWYVSPLCESVLVYFHYLDEDEEEMDDHYEEIGFVHDVDPELLEKVRLEIIDFIKECIEEARRNEFCKELESSGQLAILGIEDEYDANAIILDNQEGDSFRDTWIEVSQAMYDINEDTKLLSVPRTEAKYSTVRRMVRLGRVYGLHLDKSAVIGSNAKEYCLASNDGHEYHFDPIDIIAMESDEDVVFTVRTFIENVLSAFKKRRDRARDFDTEDSKKVFVSIEDSINAGNCYIGTYGLCQNHGLSPKKIGGIRGDVLLDLEDNQYTRRAVAQAISRINKDK